jgi:hypothetical protein
MFISYIKLGSSNLPPGIIFNNIINILLRDRPLDLISEDILSIKQNAYLEKLVNSPNLNFGAERLVGSSPTVSNLSETKNGSIYSLGFIF